MTVAAVDSGIQIFFNPSTQIHYGHPLTLVALRYYRDGSKFQVAFSPTSMVHLDELLRPNTSTIIGEKRILLARLNFLKARGEGEVELTLTLAGKR